MNIHQILAGFADGDAISHEALEMRAVFRSWGYASAIYADLRHVAPSLRGECLPLSEYSGAKSDLCLHHYGIASPAAELFMAGNARKVLVYHNITPSEYFTGFDDRIAAALRTARAGLPEIARCADAVWTVSQFNAAELRAAGARAVKVFPLIFKPSSGAQTPEPLILQKFSGQLQNILFVGRIAPNKRLEDLIEAFAWFNKTINPFSRLLLVGSPRSAPRYYTMLRMLAGDLDLPNVCFEGFASPSGLEAYYRVADVYVSPSAHEGYCLPLLEAMCHNLPVVARAVGGVPETMAGAGALYDELAPAELAALIERVLNETPLRAEILNSQRLRMEHAAQRDIGAELRALLHEFLC